MGDVLRVISEGSEKPTNIMFHANLTWPLTISYLELLLRHRMIVREEAGEKFVYRIAPKGSSLLRSYSDVTEGAAELELDKMDVKLVAKATSEARRPRPVLPFSLDNVKAAYEGKGFRGAEPAIRGRSGETHRFELVMEAAGGKKVAFVGSKSASEWDVIKAFVMQNDCECKVVVVSGEAPSAKAMELAGAYGLGIVTGSAYGAD